MDPTSLDDEVLRVQELLRNATDEEKENLISALHAKFEITDVLPPPNHEETSVQTMAAAYFGLFLVGTFGNVYVLTTIYHMYLARRTHVDNTIIFIITLSIVDFCVCLSLPFTVVDQIMGFWMFGSAFCKIHAVLENVGKILSAFILAAMAFDRYAGVCRPQKKHWRSRKFACYIVMALATFAFIILSPLWYSFTASQVVLFEKETAPFKITRMKIDKCTMAGIASQVFTWFTVILFFVCYLVPLFLVTFFYSRIIGQLRLHARQFSSSQIPLTRITLFTILVAGVYFLCWTPFWVATAFAVYMEYAGERNNSVPTGFVHIMYVIHALPFLNSAFNWLLYGALNKQLGHKHRGGRTAETATLVVNGHSTCPTLRSPSVNGITPQQRSLYPTRCPTSMSSSQPDFANAGTPDGTTKTLNGHSARSVPDDPPDPIVGLCIGVGDEVTFL